FFSSRRRHTRFSRDWSSDVCSSDLYLVVNVMSSMLFLVAIAVTYAATGSVNLAQLAIRIGELPDGLQGVIQALLLIVFSIKAARSEERRVGKEGRWRGAPRREEGIR